MVGKTTGSTHKAVALLRDGGVCNSMDPGTLVSSCCACSERHVPPGAPTVSGVQANVWSISHVIQKCSTHRNSKAARRFSSTPLTSTMSIGKRDMTMHPSEALEHLQLKKHLQFQSPKPHLRQAMKWLMTAKHTVVHWRPRAKINWRSFITIAIFQLIFTIAGHLLFIKLASKERVAGLLVKNRALERDRPQQRKKNVLRVSALALLISSAAFGTMHVHVNS